MKTSSILTLMVFFLGSISWVAAQSKKEEGPPEDPQVAPVPENAKWVLTVDAGGGADNGKPKVDFLGRPLTRGYPKTIEVTKVGRAKKQVIVWGSGKSETHWTYAGYNVVVYPSGTVDIFKEGANRNAGGPVAQNLWLSSGFLGTNWVTANNFVETDQEKGVLCNYYSFAHAGSDKDEEGRSDGSIPREMPTGTGERAMKQEAWINAETRLPVKVKMGRFEYTYKFSSAPSKLQMPEKLLKAVKIYAKRMKSLEDFKKSKGL